MQAKSVRVASVRVASLRVVFGVAVCLGLYVPVAHSGDEIRSDSSCQELWAARNQIYKSAGYCFKTTRAREYFGNGGCKFDDVDTVPISDEDRRYINEIKKLEAKKC
jgi:YARHG domain